MNPVKRINLYATNPKKAWEVFEKYGVGKYKKLAAHNYTSLDSFFKKTIGFVPKKERKDYMKELAVAFS